MSWILTRSGQHFSFTRPDADVICLEDIAAGLANECRYAGQCAGFYSVAQHSVLASRIVGEEHCREALLHDAAEAYCKDIPSPLKDLLPDYREIEHRIDLAIRRRFCLPNRMSPQVKYADLVMLATERRDLMPEDDTPWAILDGIAPLHERIQPWPPERAEVEFLVRMQEVFRND